MTQTPSAPAPRRRIAVIGAGIAGLGAAWLLSRVHDVVLFESEARLGGHARTITVRTGGREVAVDTGFIVFNRVNYPNLCHLFAELKVDVHRSDMSFAVSMDDGAVEYSGRGLRALLAQPANLLRPPFWGMLRDIARFNRTAEADAEAEPQWTLDELLQHRGFGRWFERYYLLPMSGAIWSTPRAQMRQFPAAALVRFFANHGLLSVRGHHQWWTVSGGSRRYVEKVAAAMRAEIRPRTPVEAVARAGGKIRIKPKGQEAEIFDRVVFACHADTALALLKDATPSERRILSPMQFRRNRIVLHTDASWMPKRKACWASWVYLAKSEMQEEEASVTYWMNSLQGIAPETPLFATLNPPREVEAAHVLDDCPFAHPQYDFAALAAQAALPEIQGRAQTWYCGAWTGMGFHEDGLASAVRIAKEMEAAPPWH